MELVTTACFAGLGPDERRLQIYLAAWTVAADSSLADPTCFLGLSRELQDQALYAALVSLQP